MKAARIGAPGRLDLVELQVPEPGAGEALVEVAYSGICYSDVEVFEGHRDPAFVSYPLIPGHEWSGTVRAVGPAGDSALLGRKVVGEGFRSCQSCRQCQHGDAMLCQGSYDEIGFTRPGAWAELLVIGTDQLHALDDDADLRSAAGLEPAACAADSVSRAGIAEGDRVAVVGGGTIGALAVQLLRTAGAAEIIVIEPNAWRVELATRCGATDVVVPGDARALAGSVDVVIEAAGVPSAPGLCLDLVRPGGRIVLAGMHGPETALSVRDLVAKRVGVETVFGAPRQAWRDAVAAFSSGHLDPSLLVTHELPLARAGEALTLLADRTARVGKVLLQP